MADTSSPQLCAHFAKEFTKKTKVPLSLPCGPQSSVADKRAEMKLRLAVEHTKRSLSASTGAATCAVVGRQLLLPQKCYLKSATLAGIAQGWYGPFSLDQPY